MNKENIKKYGLIFGGVLAIGVALYFILQPVFQTNSNSANNSVADSVTGFVSDVFNLESDVNEAPPLRELSLDPRDGILIDSMRQEYVNVGVSNRSDTPLLTEVAANDEGQVEEEETEDLPEVVPWFYFSPAVEPVSKTSVAQNERLLRSESLNGFAWYEVDGQLRLYQNEQPYTGFHSTAFEGWRYYTDGVQSDYLIPNYMTDNVIAQRNAMATLVPNVRYNYFFLEPVGNYGHLIESRPVNYSILYKSTDRMILTSPPGTQGSALLTTTEDFYDMPMEVVEEVTTFDGTWLRVQVGYEDLGWIEKDETFNDYVLTYYSEQELLDTIEAVLADEMQYIDARIGASFVNNETMSQVSVNNQSFFPASTQKIYVLGELYHQYKMGNLDPYASTMTMYAEDKVPGAGVIQGYPAGTAFTLDELVNLVAIYSDNTAANLLIDAVGGGLVINPHMQQLGLYDTYVNGKYYGGDNTWFTTTPEDAARFFALLYNDQVNGAPYDELLIEKFYLNSHTYIRNYIPASTSSWNKSGIGGTEQNDVATFVTPYGSYSLAVFTAEPYNRDVVAEQMATLSLRVHDAFNEIRSQLWITVDE